MSVGTHDIYFHKKKLLKLFIINGLRGCYFLMIAKCKKRLIFNFVWNPILIRVWCVFVCCKNLYFHNFHRYWKTTLQVLCGFGGWCISKESRLEKKVEKINSQFFVFLLNLFFSIPLFTMFSEGGYVFSCQKLNTCVFENHFFLISKKPLYRRFGLGFPMLCFFFFQN